MADVSYCRVLPTFWTDPKVRRQLESDQKLLLLYYFTSPHTNMVGLYYLPLRYAALEADLPFERVEEWTTGVLSPFVSYDCDTEEILVHRAARHQVGESLSPKDKRLKAVERILRDAHSVSLLRKFLELYADWPVADDLRARLPKPPSTVSTRDVDNLAEGPSKPHASPLQAPQDINSSSTATEQQQQLGPSGSEGLGGAGGGGRVDVDGIASGIIRAANRGMKANPKIEQQRFRPIDTSHGSRSDVVEWIESGIPADLIEHTVFEAAHHFEPYETNTQINSMRYFKNAVRRAWSGASPDVEETPKSNAPRSGRMTRADGLDPEKEKEDLERRQDRAIAEWADEHPDEDLEIRQAVVEEVQDEFGGGPIGAGTMELIKKSRYRQKVIDRLPSPLQLVKP